MAFQPCCVAEAWGSVHASSSKPSLAPNLPHPVHYWGGAGKSYFPSIPGLGLPKRG